MALWEIKWNLESRVELGTRAKTVLGKTSQEEMELGCSLALLKVDRAWKLTRAHQTGSLSHCRNEEDRLCTKAAICPRTQLIKHTNHITHLPGVLHEALVEQQTIWQWSKRPLAPVRAVIVPLRF